MNTVISVRANEHRHFLAAAVVLTALVIWAFSFEYRDLMHPSQFTVLVQVHGLVMFAWVGLFLTQAALIVWHRPRWHRRLGVIGIGLAALVVALGVPTSIIACRLGGDHLPPGVPPLVFMANALTDLAAFALLAGSGLALRRRPDFHKRLMLLSNFPPLIAALARLVGFLHLGIGITPLRNLLLLAFILIDTVRTRRLHPALVAGGACLIAADLVSDALVGTAMWSESAHETDLLCRLRAWPQNRRAPRPTARRRSSSKKRARGNHTGSHIRSPSKGASTAPIIRSPVRPCRRARPSVGRSSLRRESSM